MSHSDCVVFVVVVERWKSQVGGGWIVGFIFVLFVCFVFCVCMCVCVCGGCRLKSGERGRLLGPEIFFFFLLPWFMVEPDGATVEVVLLLYYDGLVFVVDVY